MNPKSNFACSRTVLFHITPTKDLCSCFSSSSALLPVSNNPHLRCILPFPKTLLVNVVCVQGPFQKQKPLSHVESSATQRSSAQAKQGERETASRTRLLCSTLHDGSYVVIKNNGYVLGWKLAKGWRGIQAK